LYKRNAGMRDVTNETYSPFLFSSTVSVLFLSYASQLRFVILLVSFGCHVFRLPGNKKDLVLSFWFRCQCIPFVLERKTEQWSVQQVRSQVLRFGGMKCIF